MRRRKIMVRMLTDELMDESLRNNMIGTIKGEFQDTFLVCLNSGKELSVDKRRDTFDIWVRCQDVIIEEKVIGSFHNKEEAILYAYQVMKILEDKYSRSKLNQLNARTTLHLSDNNTFRVSLSVDTNNTIDTNSVNTTS